MYEITKVHVDKTCYKYGFLMLKKNILQNEGFVAKIMRGQSRNGYTILDQNDFFVICNMN